MNANGTQWRLVAIDVDFNGSLPALRPRYRGIGGTKASGPRVAVTKTLDKKAIEAALGHFQETGPSGREKAQ